MRRSAMYAVNYTKKNCAQGAEDAQALKMGGWGMGSGDGLEVDVLNSCSKQQLIN